MIFPCNKVLMVDRFPLSIPLPTSSMKWSYPHLRIKYFLIENFCWFFGFHLEIYWNGTTLNQIVFWCFFWCFWNFLHIVWECLRLQHHVWLKSLNVLRIVVPNQWPAIWLSMFINSLTTTHCHPKNRTLPDAPNASKTCNRRGPFQAIANSKRLDAWFSATYHLSSQEKNIQQSFSQGTYCLEVSFYTFGGFPL